MGAKKKQKAGAGIGRGTVVALENTVEITEEMFMRAVAEVSALPWITITSIPGYACGVVRQAVTWHVVGDSMMSTSNTLAGACYGWLRLRELKAGGA